MADSLTDLVSNVLLPRKRFQRLLSLIVSKFNINILIITIQTLIAE